MKPSELNSLMKQFQYSLKHIQDETRIVVILNAFFVALIVVFRIVEGYIHSKKKDAVLSAEVFGSLSLLGLSVLECAAFLTMTTIRYDDSQKLIDVIYPLYNAAYDPILTGSALRYVYTNGSSVWLDRYNAAVDPLLASIESARLLASSTSELQLYNLTDSANTVLVELETVALNDTVAGIASLTGSLYTTNKQLYLYSIDHFVSKQEQAIYSSFASSSSLTNVLMYCAAFFTGISLLSWIRELMKAFNTKKKNQFLANSLNSLEKKEAVGELEIKNSAEIDGFIPKNSSNADQLYCRSLSARVITNKNFLVASRVYP